MSVKITRLSSL